MPRMKKILFGISFSACVVYTETVIHLNVGKVLDIHVMVQFFSWFKFYFPLFQTIIIHNHNQKQRKTEFQG